MGKLNGNLVERHELNHPIHSKQEGKGELTCASRTAPGASLSSAEAPARQPSRRRRIRQLGFPPPPREYLGFTHTLSWLLNKMPIWHHQFFSLPGILERSQRWGVHKHKYSPPGRTRLDPVPRGGREEGEERRRSSARDWSVGVGGVDWGGRPRAEPVAVGGYRALLGFGRERHWSVLIECSVFTIDLTATSLRQLNIIIHWFSANIQLSLFLNGWTFLPI